MSSLNNLENRISQIEHKINQIEQRNIKVETDKAWETSITRRIIIGIFTFVIIGSYMSAIDVKQPWLNAIIPTAGFVISTLALPFIKEIWKKYLHK